MDLGWAAGRSVRARALMKAVWNTCAALYFCYELHRYKKKRSLLGTGYRFLALHWGHGRCSSLPGIIHRPTLVCLPLAALFFFLRRGRRSGQQVKQKRVRWGRKGEVYREEAGRVLRSSDRGYRRRRLCRWRLKWVMKVVLDSCGVCSYAAELNNRGAQHLSCQETESEVLQHHKLHPKHLCESVILCLFQCLPVCISAHGWRLVSISLSSSATCVRFSAFAICLSENVSSQTLR